MSETAYSIDSTLAALADPQRRRVVELLLRGPRRPGELARELRLASPVVSRHLRVLRQSGLVEEEHPDFDARVRIYSLRPGPVRELKDWLQRMEELWSRQLASFKEHVESTGRQQSE